MKRKLLAALLLTTPFLVHAEAPFTVDGACLGKMAPRNPEPHGAFGLPPYLHGIALSEQQQERLFELSHRQMPELRAYRRAAGQALDALRELALSGRYDAGEARRLAKRAADAQSELAEAHARLDQHIWQTLTPEQRLALAGKIRR